MRAIPDWPAKHNYTTPTSPDSCPVQLATGTEENAWAWLQANPDMAERFNLTMQGIASEQKNALDEYLVQERLIKGFEGGALMVDVGGGVGHDLEVFCSKWPVQGAEYILQDQPKVVDSAEPKIPIHKLAHDFFTEQPVRGECYEVIGSVSGNRSVPRSKELLPQANHA